MVQSNYAVENVILCMFKPKKREIREKIETLIADLGCRSIWGCYKTPDMRALPCFAIIVSRPFVGRREWKQYLMMRCRTGERILCIVVDKKKDYARAEDERIKYIDMNTPGGTESIRNCIAQYLENRPKIPDLQTYINQGIREMRLNGTLGESQLDNSSG